MADEATKPEAVPEVAAASTTATIADSEVAVAPAAATEGDATTEPTAPAEPTVPAVPATANEAIEAKAAGEPITSNGRPPFDRRELRNKHKKNKKFDPSTLPDTDDPDAIRQQIHFYFGDSNLPFDQHLWTETGGPENKPVSLKHMCTFGRMKRMKPYEAVVKALKESDFVDITGEEGSEMVARKVAYEPDVTRSPREAATVYVKGFGEETPTSQFDIEAFFAKFGTINAIRLRRKDDNIFKGSVFAEFAEQEQAEAFLALETKPTWQGAELKIMSKREYVEEKSTLIKEGKIQPTFGKSKKFYQGQNARDFKKGSGDVNDFQSRRDKDQKGGFRGNGRGGRGGRGRGGHGGHGSRGGRGGRSNGNDRNAERKAAEEQAEGGKTAEEAPRSAKREREDDAGLAGEPVAKKVDVKADVATET